MELNMHDRQLVVFDPSNPEHRADYNLFVKTRSWGKAKYRYQQPKGLYFNLLHYIEKMLLQYYSLEEFKND